MPRAMGRAAVAFSVFLILILCLPLRSDSNNALPGTAPRATFSLTVEDSLYTLKASQTPLTEILRQIEAQTGVDIRVDPNLKARVTLVIENATLEELLKTLAGSHAFVYTLSANGLTLASATLTSQEQTAPLKAARAKLPDEKRTVEEQAALDARGVLSNSGKPLSALVRHGTRALILQNALIDTEDAARTGRPLDIPGDLKASPATKCYIVQFDHPVSDADRDALEAAGALVNHYVPNSAFAVHVAPDQVAAVKSLAGVQYVEAYHPYFKLSRDVLSYFRGEADSTSRERVEKGVFNVLAFRGEKAADAFRKHDADVLARQTTAGRETYVVQCTPEALRKLVLEDAVLWVEPRVPAEPMNDLGGRRLGATQLKLSHPSLNGDGVTVAVTDTGVDFVHRGFAIDQNLPTGTGVNSRIAYYQARPGPFTEGVPGDKVGHGTHVSGSILGNGALSATAAKVPGSGNAPYATNKFAGVAPKARLVMLEDMNSFTNQEQTRIAYQHGARIHNNSWGKYVFEYGTDSADWDALVRDADDSAPGDQEYIVFFSAGNAGAGGSHGLGATEATIAQPANAKNVIAVGALEQPRFANNFPSMPSIPESDSDFQVASFSSRGPATPGDFRVKPDLVAPGSYVLSLQSRETLPDLLTNAVEENWDYRYGNVDSGTNYAFMSGTSMSSPLGAGSAALVWQYWTNVLGREPSPAMMKAILVNGARMVDAILYQLPGWRFDGSTIWQPAAIDQGWGGLDVERAVDGPGVYASEEVQWFDQADNAPVITGQTATRNYTVNVKEGGLKVTLAWTDEPGTPGNGIQLVNDLDLVVIGPDGVGYVGNFLDASGLGSHGVPGFTRDAFTNAFGDVFDRNNNVEQVLIPDAEPGVYQIQVYGAEVPEGPQDYALAVTKGLNMIESHQQGDHPRLALDSNSWPIVAYSGYDAGGHKQVFVMRWIGSAGNQEEIGLWKRLEDHWFDIDSSARDTGISKTIEESSRPSIAVRGDNIYVAWQEDGQTPGAPSHVFLRRFDGTEWTELNNSAHGIGVSANGEYDATDPVVTLDLNGQPIVAWSKGVLEPDLTFTYRIFAARWNGTNWASMGSSFSNGIPGYTYAVRPDIAVDNTGRVVVAWEEQSNLRIRIRRWNNSTWESLPDRGDSPYAGIPKLVASRTTQDVYLAWVQQPDGVPPHFFSQIYVARLRGSSWSAVSTNSMVYPGISAGTNADTSAYGVSIALDSASRPVVAWDAGDVMPSAIFLKRFNGTNWVGVVDSDVWPGIARCGGLTAESSVAMDRNNLPVVAFQSFVSTHHEVMVYRVVTDDSPPGFDGLKTATGGTNQNVSLAWQPASDFSTNIYYTIFRSLSSFGCGETPDCTVTDVFSHPIAVVTNMTTYEVTGLTNDRVYCFGVRAADDNGLAENNTIMRSAGPTDPSGDADADCILYATEIAIGTEPCLKDTDSDGMWDGWEWTYSTNNVLHTNALAMNPLDNGVDNVRTLTANDGTPSQLPTEDLDGDGASNLEEFDFWHSNYLVVACAAVGPDPTNPDTDGDGIPDGWEMINGLDPMNPADAAADPDADGLSNLQEYQLGTDPQNPDSDSDGIIDGVEFANGTNPALADSDRDGLDDGVDPDPRDAESLTQGIGDGDVIQLGYAGPVAGVFSNLLVETFETSTRTNWTHYAPNAWPPWDLWHLSTADPLPQSNTIRMLHQRSTNTSYRMANDPTRTNAAALYSYSNKVLICALRSPLFNARGVSNLFVAWNEFVDTEADTDLTIVHGRSGTDPNWYPLSAPVSGPGTAWVYRVADISRFAGASNIQLRWHFSADAMNNTFHGWYVDDVWVYGGVTITGWVRDVNGAPIAGARVLALGRDGITNAVQGHRHVRPGKVFGEGVTAGDGSYRISGLPQGRFYVKATDPNHRDEFYDGPLYSNRYGFARGQHAGVFERDQVSARGWINLQGSGSRTNCDFELEPGASRSYLGVALANPAGTQYEVFLNGGVTGLQISVWNGSTSTPSFVAYLTSTNPVMANNHPDWVTNAVLPTLIGAAAPGSHLVFAGTNLNFYPPPEVTLREGEITLVNIYTNQGEGRLYVKAEDGGAYPIWLNGWATTNRTPAVLAVKAGTHRVTLIPTNGTYKIAPKVAQVRLGNRSVLEFTTNDLGTANGSLEVRAVDIRGNAITGAVVFVDGQEVTTSDTATGWTNTTPTRLNKLKPGAHTLTVKKDGFQLAEFRTVAVVPGGTTVSTFVLYQSDRDYDGVGDWTEISGYSDLFLYSRDDDPDADNLSNLFEFDLLRLYGIAMNTFNADSDGDGMQDGAEVGYDGRTNLLALSSLATNAVQGTPTVRALFVGQYLAGVNNFGNGNVAAAIQCDRFEASGMSATNPPVPSAESATTLFSGIPASVTERAVSQGHNKGAEVLADTLPDRKDTDGDGMWDGFEAQFKNVWNKLDPIECGHTEDDPDGDSLSNYLEFLGPDGVANTNDWSDPNDYDSDGDGMPDGWESIHGLNPHDPADATDDPDHDGLPNVGEYSWGTNPWLADTDADFLPDFWEVLWFNTNPRIPDTDYDGLMDGREVWDKDANGIQDGGFFPNWLQGNNMDGDLPDPDNWYITGIDGPTDWDTDGDGMPDGFEVLRNDGSMRNPALDPSNPNDGDDDSDGDGLSNLQEYLVRDALYGHPPSEFGFGGVVWDYSTDPFDSDSDDDGMPDGWEVLYGLHPMDPISCGGSCLYTRFPDLAVDGDVDHDGLNNQREFSVRFQFDPNATSNSAFGASTDPWDPDTDDDGLGDGEEDRSFRCNPVLQDTDGDRLMDGVGLAGTWGEVWSTTNAAATNHFDQALDDLWKLVWPVGFEFPYWTNVTLAATNKPGPRWGAALTYIPVFETKISTNTILLDNRQLVVLGGRNGVKRYADVWEYVIRSNVWQKSNASLGDVGLTNGLSEFSAVSVFGYYNTRSNTCPCLNTPYLCDGDGFGVPKNRPWDRGYHHSSFDWTYVLGGWDQDHEYYFPTPIVNHYYKSSDSSDAVTDQMENDVDGYELNKVVTAGSEMPLANYNGTNVLNGFHYSGVSLLSSCERLVRAELDFSVYSPTAVSNDLFVVGELWSDGESPAGFGDPLLSQRTNSSEFLTSVLPFTMVLPGGAARTNVDITTLMQQVMAAPGWASKTLTFIVWGTATNTTYKQGTTILRATYVPSYKTGAFWREGIGRQVLGNVPTPRKSLVMVYDYDRDRIVAFGGMDGRQVFGDTYEGTPYWIDEQGHSVAGNPDSIGTPDKVEWEKKSPSSSPTPRWGHAMTYDPVYQRVVLFGGFDANQKPLNDLWSYANGTWTQVRDFIDSQKPQPRGGASLAFFGGFDYDGGASGYCIVGGCTNVINRLVLFGGTDGRVYFNDTWVYDEDYFTEVTPRTGKRWLLVRPVGEAAGGPTPRAFASFVFTQNGGVSPDPQGYGTFAIVEGETRCATPAAYLFGGRSGTLPTSRDTDDDLVEDGTEFEIGGPAAGRDPRVNALITTNTGETYPFAIKHIGSVNAATQRLFFANLEALSYPSWDERQYAEYFRLPFEGRPSEGFKTNGVFLTGVDAQTPDMTNLWYHRSSAANPVDAWELGVPDNTVIGSLGAPPYAYSGRWSFGTDLNGTYPNNALMDLYSPVFNLKVPSSDSSYTNNFNSYFLVFHEWLNLADSNDVVRVSIIRPQTPSQIVRRETGKPAITVVPTRNNAYNTTGAWRRVIAPLDALANETNLYVRFTLQSDASGVAGGWYVDDIWIVQGSEISGLLTNAPGVQVALLGVNFNGHVQASTITDGSGLFQFGLLPFGRYIVGAVSTVFGPFTLGPTNTDVSMGSTNLPPFSVTPVYGMPTSVSWPAVPGVTYEVQYSYDLVNWFMLATVTAASTTETFLDYTGDPLRFYRVLYLGSP